MERAQIDSYLTQCGQIITEGAFLLFFVCVLTYIFFQFELFVDDFNWDLVNNKEIHHKTWF